MLKIFPHAVTRCRLDGLTCKTRPSCAEGWLRFDLLAAIAESSASLTDSPDGPQPKPAATLRARAPYIFSFCLPPSVEDPVMPRH